PNARYAASCSTGDSECATGEPTTAARRSIGTAIPGGGDVLVVLHLRRGEARRPVLLTAHEVQPLPVLGRRGRLERLRTRRRDGRRRQACVLVRVVRARPVAVRLVGPNVRLVQHVVDRRVVLQL